MKSCVVHIFSLVNFIDGYYEHNTLALNCVGVMGMYSTSAACMGKR